MSYLLFNLGRKDTETDGNNHFLLQLLLLFFIIIGVLLMGKAVDDSGTVCEVVINESIVNVNTTSYTYMNQCYESTNNTPTIFYKLTLWFVRLTSAYIFLYFVYQVLLFLGWVVPK